MIKILELLFRANTKELDDASRKVEDLGKKTEVAGDKVARGSKKGADGLKILGQGAEDVEKGFSSLFGKMGGGEMSVVAEQVTSLGTRFGMLGAVVGGTIGTVVAANAALGVIAAAAREAADAQDEMAQKMGVSRDRLVMLQLAASENGGSVEGLIRTYDKLSRSMNKMDDDNERTKFAFESLGSSFDEVRDKSPAEVANLLIERWTMLGGTAKATAAIVQLLGPAWRENSLAIKEAAGNTQDLENRVRSYGGVASDNLVKLGGEQEKALSNLKNAWQELKNQVGESTGSMSTNMTNWAANAAKAIADYVKSLREAKEQQAEFEKVMGARSGGPNKETVGLALQRQAQSEADAAYLAGTGPYPTAAVVFERVKALQAEQTQIKKTAEAYTSWRDSAKEAEAAVAKAKSTAAKSPEQLKAEAEAAKKAEEERKKAAEAAQKAMEAWMKGNATAYKAQQQALDDLAKDQQAIDEYNAKELEKKKAQLRELEGIQKQLAVDAKAWTDALSRPSYGMLRRETKSPMEQAQAQAKDTAGQLTQRFGGEAAKLQTKAQEAMDAGDWEKSQRYTAAAKEQMDTLTESLRLNDWMLQKVAADSQDGWDGMRRGMKAFADQMPTLNTAMSDFTQNTLQDFSDRLANMFINGKFGFQDFVKTAIAELIKLQARMLVTKAAMAFMGAADGAAFSSGGSLMTKADGGAFEGGVQKFATGGIVSSPTLFGYSGGMGVMGEAGPEAIMPLTRVGGKLGVVASGMGGVQVGSITINVQGGSTNEETGKVVAESVMKAIADARIYEATRSNGIIRQAFQR